MSVFKPQLERSSLLAEILDWMLTPLLLLWPVSMVLTWVVVQNVAGRPYDRALEYNANALAQLVSVQNGRAVFNLPAPARELLRADDIDTIYYQVLGLRGELVSGERDLPLPPETEKPQSDGVHLRTDELRGTEIRIAYTWTQPDPRSNRLVLIQVAETLDKRSLLATEIIRGDAAPICGAALGRFAHLVGAGPGRAPTQPTGESHPRSTTRRPQPDGPAWCAR
jgi:two-component system, OmpR family, sensor histidine kinase TctE